MSNSSTSPVQYPLPYKVINGCLYKEVTTKSGITTKKLSNFLPYIVKEVSVDDGVEEKYELRLGGVHSSGRLLPEIDVSGSELGNFNWLIERWGADCVLEPERSIKETVRHAIQLTTENAEKIHVYHVTGWKHIDGKWEYLLPNDGKYDVSLRGKLSRYEKATDWKISDLSSAFFMTSEFSFAPDEITLPLLAFTFLTPLNEFLHQANYEPKFVLCLLGKTGTRKSTLAALFLSFYGRFSGSDLPLSFRDTANSIMYNAFSLKDVLTCIDDFHPSVRKEVNRLTETAQLVMRGYGDRIGRGKLKSDSTPMESRPPQGNAIITAEQAPDIGESGTARYFSLELRDGMIDLKNLSSFQREAEKGTLRSCMLAYTEWIKSRYLKDKDAVQSFVENLKNLFESYRDEFSRSGILCHGRVPEMFAWLMIGMEYFLSFLLDYEIISEEDCQSTYMRCRDCLYELAKKQSMNIEQDKPTHVFIQKLYSLIESGQAFVLNRFNPPDYLPNGFVGYEDDKNYYLNADAAHTMVKSLCDKQGENFTILKNDLLKALAEEGISRKEKKSGKEDGRSYYHIVQSFSPDDDLTPETAHEIGLKFADYFPGFQIVVATHVNTNAIHNHLIMNSVNYENGKMFHQSRNEMLQAKEYSNQVCREYGLSVTEVKTKNPRHAKWKRDLLQVAEYALGHSATKEEFIEYMRYHGYGVQWEDKYKYITFTSPEGWKVRDNKLFDERFLKDNLEIYFALGGCDSAIIDPYFDYVTPNHPDSYTMTYSDGLINLLGDLLSTVPDDYYYQPQYIDEISTAEKERIEKILGRRICNEAFYTYCTREDYEREQGLSM